MKKQEPQKKYIVSGIPPSNGGVGRLMKRLVPVAKARNYRIVTKKNDESISLLIGNKKYLSAIYKIIRRIAGWFNFHLKMLFIKNTIIVFIHPQTAGFKNLLRLINNNNKVYYYVMDNSFFCIRSYNVNPKTEDECLRCIGNPDRNLQECQPSPVNYSKKSNIKYLKDLKKHSNQIQFLAQNHNQAILIKEHFGKDTNIKVIGLDTGELINSDKSGKILNERSFDFVFHGSANIAKGLRYFVNIAKRITDKTFFIPSSREACERVLSINDLPSNITFKQCAWETGLMEIISNSKFVLNPSLWSAPIEGALLKSIYYNGRVITVKTEYGFENELSNQIDIIRISRDPKKGAEQLIKILANSKFDHSNKNFKWISKFKEKNSIQNLFNFVEDDYSRVNNSYDPVLKHAE